MRIAMIGQRGVPATYGGVERHVEELSTRLAARGHQVTVFCRREYSNGSTPDRDGVTLRYPPTVTSKHLEAVVHSGISTMMSLGGGFDIVHFHALGPGLWSPIPRWMSKARVVQTIHGLDHQRAKWGRLAQSALRTGDYVSQRVPDAVIVVGRYLLEHYRRRRRMTVHVPNGVTTTSGRNDSILRRLGLDGDGYALFVGRLTPEKGVDHLVEAFKRLETDQRLVIVGGSSFTDDYERRVRDLASDDDRIILCGYVYGDELASLYGNADVYVQPSILEGVPLTVLEAAAHGIPLVLSDIPAHREILPVVRPGGRLFEVGNRDSLASALSEALRSASGDRPAAQVAAADIQKQFSWDSSADLTESVYLQLVG